MNVSSCVVCVFVVVGLAACNAMPSEERKEPAKINTVSGAEKCSEVKGIDNAITCVAMSVLRRLEDLTVKENIEIIPGIVLSSEIPKAERETRQKRTMELPKTYEEKMTKLFDTMFNIMTNLFSGRTLKIKMTENTSNSVMRALEEGRGKMKKLAGPLMMALGAKMIAIVPIMLGGLALFASKAIIVSKLALVIALIIGAQYMFSQGGGGFFSRLGQGGWGPFNNAGFGHGGGHNYMPYGAPAWGSAWNTAASQNYGYSRSLHEAQDLAYKAHKE